MSQNMLSVYPLLTEDDRDVIKRALYLWYNHIHNFPKHHTYYTRMTDQELMFTSREVVIRACLKRAYWPALTIMSANKIEIELLEKLGVW